MSKKIISQCHIDDLFVVVPETEVNTYLKRGYILHGSPTYKPNKKRLLYQALLKPSTAGFSVAVVHNQSEIQLTTIEAKCLYCLANDDLNNLQIAKKLNRSVRTVEKNLASLRKKFSCRNNARLIREAQKSGHLIDTKNQKNI